MIQPHDRAPELALRRNLKMARSAHAYVRGSTVKFYQWLAKSGTRLPVGPSVWICGDCHIGNLGPLADAKGRVAVQIRDLDQTVIGNPTHDLVRLGLSLASAARSADLSGVVTSKMLAALARGYHLALASDFSKGMDLAHKPKNIQRLLQSSVKRRWHHLATERLEDVKPRLPLGKRFWPVTAAESDAISALFKTEHARRMITSLSDRADDAKVTVVDTAYWVKGCSSLGRLRYAVLLKVNGGKQKSYCLVDIKEGTRAAAPSDPTAQMPKDNAERVISGARALSPYLGQRMISASLLGKPVIVRELMPQDLKLEIETLDDAEAVKLSRYLGYTVGRAHGRQLSATDRRHWMKDLKLRANPETMVPTWLWSCVIDLMGIHEAAYLDHCRVIASSIM